MAGKSKNDTAGVTPYIQKDSVQFQPAPPGDLERLAAQLQSGYGGDQQANLDYLNNLYRPMSLPMPTQYDPGNPPAGGSTGNNPLGQILDPLRGLFDPLLDPLRDIFNR